MQKIRGCNELGELKNSTNLKIPAGYLNGERSRDRGEGSVLEM